MPGGHVSNIRLGGDPLKPGVSPEAEGERFKSVKEAGRVRRPRVAFNKGRDRARIVRSFEAARRGLPPRIVDDRAHSAY